MVAILCIHVSYFFLRAGSVCNSLNFLIAITLEMLQKMTMTDDYGSRVALDFFSLGKLRRWRQK